jgi:hypothetical protein
MQTYDVDDELAALVERLAKKRPFENLSFNEALRRVLAQLAPVDFSDLDALLAEGPNAKREPKKAPSPSTEKWVASVPELRTKKGLRTWKSVCDLLKIETAGDSARRRLKNWVNVNRPSWPPVPDID